MPQVERKPTLVPYSEVLAEQQLVSFTPAKEKKTGKWAFPAYGEEPYRTGR
jgi:hypothetical protein